LRTLLKSRLDAAPEDRSLSNGEAMSVDALDDYIDAVASALALPIDDAWRPAIRANLDVSLRMGRIVDEFVLPDETEPASVFTA
jgi:hypothetical protein